MKIKDEYILSLIKTNRTTDEGYRLLMSTYQKRLYHHIMSMVNSHDDTNDVLQNTFIKVFKYVGKFEGRSNLYTWMFRIATNEASSFLKKKVKINSFIDNSVNNEYVQIGINSDNINADYIKEVLTKAIKVLPVKQKEVFSLRYFEEMSYKDMSNVLDTSVGALKASYHHAVKKIEVYVKQFAEQ